MNWYLIEFTIGYTWKYVAVEAYDVKDAKSKLPRRARNVRCWLTK